MADNQHYRLARRVAAAYEAAELSCSRADFDYFHSLNAIAEAEKHQLKTAAYRIVHGAMGSVGDLPHWSQVSRKG